MSFRQKLMTTGGLLTTGLLAIAWLLALLAPVGYRADLNWWPPLLIGLTSLLFLGGLGICQRELTRATSRQHRWLAVGTWTLLIAVQLWVTVHWIAGPRADLYFVHQQALALLNGSHHWAAYFGTYPNNVPMTVLLAGILQVGRWLTGQDSGVWLNLVQFAWLDVGVAVMAHHLRRKSAPQAALFLGLVLTSVPLYAYALNTYSDTVVLPAVLLTLVAAARLRQATTWPQGLGRGLVLGLLLAGSFVFKANFIVLFIASILALWVLPVRWSRPALGKAAITLLLGACLLGGIGGNRAVQHAVGYTNDPNQTLPALSWIAMSWNPGYHGDYNPQDADAVIQAPTAAAKQARAKLNLQNHFTQMGVGGSALHLFRKAQLFLATGTFDAFQINSAFDRQPAAYRQHQVTIDWLLANWAQLSYCGLLLVNLVWGWRQFRRRQFTPGFLLGGLFALGLTAFHVIFWETEERYALPLLPLLLAGTAMSARLPQRVTIARPSTVRRWATGGLVLLTGLALIQGAFSLTADVNKSVSLISQNEGRYYQDHRLRLKPNASLTQPLTIPAAFNELQIDPHNQRHGQVTLTTASGKRVWQSARHADLDNLRLPRQVAGTYHLTVTNRGRHAMHLVTAPSQTALLPQALTGHPHQYLRVDVNHALSGRLLTPKRYALFATLVVLLTAGIGTWYWRWWQNQTN